MAPIFNNREIATGIWLTLFILVGAKNVVIRESVQKLVKSFWKVKIVVPLLIMTSYIALCVLLMQKIHLWNALLLKDTIYWFLFSAIVLFINLVTGDDYAVFFRKTIIDCFKIIVLLEFLLNFYTFPLLVELILVPVLVYLGAASAYAEFKPEHIATKKFLDFTLAIIGFAIAGFVARNIYLHYSGLLKYDVLLNVLLPILLTILFLPFLYFSKLISDYELLFVRLPCFVKKDEKLLAYIKKRILIYCHFDLRRLSWFSKKKLFQLSSVENKDDADRMFMKLKLGTTCDAKE